jgi:hypothetical protein
MRWWPIVLVLALVWFGLRAHAPSAVAAATAAPAPAATVTVPPDYRSWAYVTSGLSMKYAEELKTTAALGPHQVQPLARTAAGGQVFHNVFVTPAAYKYFVANGHWPDKTMFVLEIRAAVNKDKPFLTQGLYQAEIVDLKAELRDDARYPVDKWKWFSFTQKNGAWQPAAPEPNASCFDCHTKHGAVDKSFVQFYPTLYPIAQAKGTLNPGFK